MLIAMVAASAAEPIAPSAIEVIDGDTIRGLMAVQFDFSVLMRLNQGCVRNAKANARLPPRQRFDCANSSARSG